MTVSAVLAVLESTFPPKLLVLQNQDQRGNRDGLDGFGGFGGYGGFWSWRLPPLNSAPLFRHPENLASKDVLGEGQITHLICARLKYDQN